MKRFLNNKRQRYQIVSAEDEGLLEYFKQHPNVAGMAIGEGLNGIEGQRRIVHNPYSTAISNPNDPRWEALDRVESIRHYMDETNYAPTFKFSPEQIRYRQTELKGTPYETNDRAWRQSIISRIAVGDTAGLNITPEQQAEYNNFIKGFEGEIEPYKYDRGGPFGTKQVVKGKDPHNNRQYIKSVYIPFLPFLKKVAKATNSRGHLPDIVKGKDHPSGPSYGKFLNDLQFEIKDPANINYVRPGLNDNGDYKAAVTYKGSRVLPEITITPNGNYIEDPYNNIKFLYAKGGSFRIPSTFSPSKTKEWIKYWYSNRSPQIQKNIKEARSTQAQWNKQMNTINTYKWYQSPKYLPQKIKSKASKNDFDDRRINGMTLPDYKTIYFNNPTYPGSSIQVHEGTHSQEPKIQKAIIPRHIKLKSGQYKDSYYDDPDEINSRVMEFRYINKLNPKRRYSIEEIRKMKDEGDGGTSWPGGKRPLDILNRYDDSTLLYLINGLAYNNNYKDQDIQYTQPDPLSAKKGSKIAKHSWSANFGHTVDGNPNLDNMKNDYVTKKKKKHA